MCAHCIDSCAHAQNCDWPSTPCVGTALGEAGQRSPTARRLSQQFEINVSAGSVKAPWLFDLQCVLDCRSSLRRAERVRRVSTFCCEAASDVLRELDN